MKKLAVFIATASMLASTSVFAEGSYVGFSLGLQANLGNLGSTIATDGLDSGQGVVGGSSAGTCDGSGTTNCYREVGPARQSLIVAENELIALEKSSAMLFRADTTSGAMIGLVADGFYEMDFGGTFARGGIQYTKRIAGGRTRASVAGINWLSITWDYYAWTIPLYYGVKVSVGESGAVYGAIGINYTYGGWNLGGTNNGDIPLNLTGRALGATTTIDNVTGRQSASPVLYEAIKFRTDGIGYNALIGVETRTESGNALFFEVEYIVNGGYASAEAKSVGGAQGLAPIAAYPIVTGGTKFKFGYKLAL